MKSNAIRQRLRQGQAVNGTMIHDQRSPTVAQILAQVGYDFLFIDMEHGPFNLETVADLVRVTRLAGATPLLRVPDAEYHWIARALDLGAQGLMIPRVETKAQVEYIVECALYPPLGARGCSVDKGHNDFASQEAWSFTEEANRENLIILQIERQRAVEDIGELLSVPGVGAALIGPNDLALSLGVRGGDMLARLEEPIQHVLDACLGRGIPCGIHIGDLEWLAEWQRRGMQLLCYSSDAKFLRQAASEGLRWLQDQSAHV
jgi:2-dehydro-3-deoxyglucarate aldolase/4-hydroxy-2-oxoheptanedioate aldolase